MEAEEYQEKHGDNNCNVMTGKEPKCTGGEKMFRRFVKKLHSRAGESIGETLVAVLISALALLILAGAVSAAARILTRSDTTVKGIYETGSERAIIQNKPSSAVFSALESAL